MVSERCLAVPFHRPIDRFPRRQLDILVGEDSRCPR
jgi:hypothetical protein